MCSGIVHWINIFLFRNDHTYHQGNRYPDTCGGGLYFDTVIYNCNHPMATNCNGRPVRGGRKGRSLGGFQSSGGRTGKSVGGFGSIGRRTGKSIGFGSNGRRPGRSTRRWGSSGRRPRKSVRRTGSSTRRRRRWG